MRAGIAYGSGRKRRGMQSSRIRRMRESQSGERGLFQQAYDEIRRRILSGELRPSSVLSEHQLATSLQLSRTPVREAIKRLEQEGLVQSLPNRGTFVTELSAHDILEIYQIRERLESLAARIAAEHMTPDEVRALEQEIALTQASIAEGHITDAFAADIRFHKLIIAVTQNERLSTVLATFDDQMYRVRALLTQSSERLQTSFDQHRAIVERIQAHDGPGAERVMEEHLRLTCEWAMRLTLPVRPRAQD